jgi:hypothetical protein
MLLDDFLVLYFVLLSEMDVSAETTLLPIYWNTSSQTYMRK